MKRSRLKGKTELFDDAEGTKPQEDFCVKYRPQTWDEVIGHDEVCASIKGVIDRREKRCFVITGESGLGKTTLARILANYLGGEEKVEYREIDAATYTGIDAMRGITEWMQYQPFVRGGKKVVCIDEAHSLSKPAIQSLLKAVEEPPRYGYWIFCTTEGGKIPNTIRTRCICYDLQPVKVGLIMDLLLQVCEMAELEIPEDVLDVVAKEAHGSPRQALSYLSKCREAQDRAEAATLLKTAAENPEVIELCRGLVRGGLNWAKAMKILKGKEGMNPESIRINIVAYLTKVVEGAKDTTAAGRAVEIMDNFLGGPYYQGTGLAELYRDLAGCLLS